MITTTNYIFHTQEGIQIRFFVLFVTGTEKLSSATTLSKVNKGCDWKLVPPKNYIVPLSSANGTLFSSVYFVKIPEIGCLWTGPSIATKMVASAKGCSEKLLLIFSEERSVSTVGEI